MPVRLGWPGRGRLPDPRFEGRDAPDHHHEVLGAAATVVLIVALQASDLAMKGGEGVVMVLRASPQPCPAKPAEGARPGRVQRGRSRYRPSAMSSRWMSSARPSKPRISAISLDLLPMMRPASSAP